MAIVPGYRLFNVTLLSKHLLTPSLMRCRFTGAQVTHMKIDGPDQRIKILFPSLSGTHHSLSGQGSWWEQLKGIPAAERPIPRTYTLRRLVAAENQLEVEFVLHGAEGPASSWAMIALPGDSIQIVAPNREHTADSGGYEWQPHDEVEQALIIADETALPAVKSILEHLARENAQLKLQVFLEVPLQQDCINLSEYDFADIHWLPRDRLRTSRGEALVDAVKAHAILPEQFASFPQELSDVAGQEILWQSAVDTQHQFYGWVAAESSVVKHIRRYLLNERNVPGETVSFMAYWCMRAT